MPAWRKKRFGHVGPGTEANQWSQTTKLRASEVMTGTRSGSKHCMIALPASSPIGFPPFPACAA